MSFEPQVKSDLSRDTLYRHNNIKTKDLVNRLIPRSLIRKIKGSKVIDLNVSMWHETNEFIIKTGTG